MLQMSFFLRFSKYISVPILAWLEVVSFVRLEIAFSRSKCKLIELTIEFPELLGQSLFSSSRVVTLTRDLVLWYAKHELMGWNGIEVVISPSLMRAGVNDGIFGLCFGRQVDEFQTAIQKCVKSLKKAKLRRKTRPDLAVSLLQHCLSLESLECWFNEGFVWRAVARLQSLCSITIHHSIESVVVTMLCQLPNLVEIHLLSSDAVNHSSILLANPRLTMLTLSDAYNANVTLDCREIRCQLKSFRSGNMLEGANFTRFLVEGKGASLTSLADVNLSSSGSEMLLLATHCPLLTDLTLSYRQPYFLAIADFLVGLPLLTSLNVSNFLFLPNEYIEQAAHNCPLLVKLSLPGLIPALSLLPNITMLSCGHLVVHTAAILDACSFTQLKHFEHRNIDIPTVCVLTRKCVGLEVLRLGSYTRGASRNGYIQLLCIQQSNLRELAVNEPLSCETLIAILQYCPKLVKFEVEASWIETKEQLKRIIALMVRLKVLSFKSDNAFWSAKRLLSVAHTCRRLESFTLKLVGKPNLFVKNCIAKMHRVNPDLEITIE